MSTAQGPPRPSASSRWIRRGWPWLVILLPLFVYLAYVPRFGALQNNDYFGSIVPRLSEQRGPAKRFERYLKSRSNEHRIAVPMLVYDANMRLWHGSNRPLSLFALAMMALVFTLLYRQLPEAARRGPPQRILFGLILACFAFVPVAAHNVAMGFSGTMWFLSNAAFAAALTLLIRRGREAGVLGLWPVALCGLWGLLSYSTSLAMWPALLVAGLCVGLSWRQLTALIAVAAACYGYYFGTYVKPRSQPAPNTSDPLAGLEFFGTYMGAIFSEDLSIARVVGWAGVVLALGLLVYVLARRRDLLPRLAPWLAIMTFGLVNAAGTSIGRSSFSNNEGVASRYATLPGFFWAGLLVAFGCVILHARIRESRQRMALLALALVFLGLAAATYARGLPMLESFARRAKHQALTELALVLGHQDEHALRRASPAPHQVWKARKFFKRIGHYPFHRPLPQLPEQLTSRAEQPAEGMLGGITNRAQLKGSAVRLMGWATVPPGSPQIVAWAVTDARGRSVGRLTSSLPTPGKAKKLTDESYAGWAGYARTRKPEALRVYVQRQGDDTWYPLPAS